MVSSNLTRESLGYASHDPRRARRRLAARAALILSAVALAIACRLVYARFAGPLREHVGEFLAQRRVLSIREAGVSLDYDATPRATPLSTRIVQPATSLELTRAESIWLAAFPPAGATLPPMIATTQGFEQAFPRYFGDASDLVYLGPITNAAGVERIISLRITPMLCENHTPQFSLQIRERVRLLDRSAAPATRWAGGMFMGYASVLHVDPPKQDAADARRLLVSGTRDGVRFAFELMLDVADRPQWFDLVPRPVGTSAAIRESPSTQSN